MKVKKSKGFVGIDMLVAIIAITLFSGLIVSLMYNNYLQNIKARRDALATIYLTEIFENVGIASFNEVTQENAQSFIPKDLAENKYEASITVTPYSEGNTNILKKVQAVISYNFNNKQYKYTMERNKIMN